MIRINPSCCQVTLAFSSEVTRKRRRKSSNIQIRAKGEEKTFLLMLMLMDLRGYGEVDWIWRGTKSKNIILIYGASVWSEIKLASPFSTSSVRDLRSKCNKISQFFSSDGSVPGETFVGEEEKEKLLQKPNPLIAQPAQTDENKREKTKKMCGKFSFAFLEQQSIFLILSFVVLLRQWGSGRASEKKFGMFSPFDSIRRR